MGSFLIRAKVRSEKVVDIFGRPLTSVGYIFYKFAKCHLDGKNEESKCFNCENWEKIFDLLLTFNSFRHPLTSGPDKVCINKLRSEAETSRLDKSINHKSASDVAGQIKTYFFHSFQT